MMKIHFSMFSCVLMLSGGVSAQVVSAEGASGAVGADAKSSTPATVTAAGTEVSTAPVAQEEPPPPTYADGKDEQPVSSELAPPADTSEAGDLVAPKPPRGPQKQTSIYLGSPIFLSNAPLDPGFEMEIRSGLKLGLFTPEIGVGTRWNWIDVDKVREEFPGAENPEQFRGENLNGVWLSLGVRLEPKVEGKLTPYVSVAFDANIWGVSFDRSQVCGVWSCSSVRNYDFAPGFSSRLGVRFTPKPAFGLDIGVKPALSFQGWAFEKTQTWIEPYAGITILLDSKPGASTGGRH